MFNCFFPDEYLDSTYVINFDDLYAQGYRGLLFDIDNTLVPHGAPADERACALFAHLKELGFKCCFLSNNQYERVSSFNDAIGAQFIENAHKPSTKNYIRAMELLGTDRSNTVFIGDQLFTDIYGAKRTGIRNIPDHMSDRNKISDQNAPIQYNPKTDSCKVLSLLLSVFIPVILPVTVHSVHNTRISYHCLQSRVNQNSTPLS